MCYEGGLHGKNTIAPPNHDRLNTIKGDDVSLLEENYTEI